MQTACPVPALVGELKLESQWEAPVIEGGGVFPVRVLFLCTGNSCRSQMAEGLLRYLGGVAVEATSAGMHPKPVHPGAVRCMAEIGVDISSQRSKSVEPFLAERFGYVITLCDSAKESCPVMAGAQEQLHWSLPDPAAAEGSDEEKMQVFRGVREDLTRRIDSLLAGILDRFLAHMAAKTKIAGAPNA